MEEGSQEVVARMTVTTDAYAQFLKTKELKAAPCGKEPDGEIHPTLYDFQRAIVKWACRRGRAAVWADCGIGKTFILGEWAKQIGGRTIILAPLAVCHQTVEMLNRMIGMDIRYCRTPEEARGQKVFITNYQRLSLFDDQKYDAVVCDESSIIKSQDGKTRTKLIKRFAGTPYRLACTATPAPNDYIELGQHAEFLGIMTWQEMAATFFVHYSDDDEEGGNGSIHAKWRLKGHAQDDFWKWLVSWGVFVKKPSDIGYSDERFILPPLGIEEVVVESDMVPDGHLFMTKLKGIEDRTKVRHKTLEARVMKAAELIAAEQNESWIAWCGLNQEADTLAAMLGGDGECRNVQGSDDSEEKAKDLLDFAHGEYRCLVTKGKLAGHGMNFQRCARQVFVGLNDSMELYYQCIRRSWRFGQTRPVKVYIVVSEIEREIVANVKRKELEAAKMSEEMVKRMSDLEKQEIHGAERETTPYERAKESGDGWTMHLGDTIEVLDEFGESSVDFSVFSPAFGSLYVYSASDRDLGNSKNEEQFFAHFKFFTDKLLRVTKPGRLTACHVSQVPAMQNRDGYIGLKDFRGRVIDTFKASGWVHHGEIGIGKDPQAQALRTHAHALLFMNLRKDSTMCRPCLIDYILVFRKPGENQVPVKPQISNVEWVSFAHGIWTDISETEVLEYREAKEDKDEKHICALQLQVIDRCIRLWTNPGELVLDPFAGIGSTGHQAILRERRFVGIELKRSYYETAVKNLKRVEVEAKSGTLFAQTNGKENE